MTTIRLALGSAQFGMPYGISNAAGHITSAECGAVLLAARQAGMDTIDTAIAYGDSERILGELGVGGWRVVSKLPPVSGQNRDVLRWVEQSASESLARLRIPVAYGFLLHRSQDLLGPNGERLYRGLQRLKESGAVQKIGVSVYEPAELDALPPRLPIDLVQAPFNILDRRLKTSGWIDRLKTLGVELHSRSAFLQGLLLMPRDQRPAQFNRWRPLWSSWDRWLDETGQSALQACLGFVLSEPGIDRVVVGVNSRIHLSQVLTAATPSQWYPPAELSTDDRALIHPSRWIIQ